LKLARLLRSGDLTAVWVPDQEQERMRDLSRARDDMKSQERKARQQRVPQLLTRAEVARILAACEKGKYRMMLTLCYGCGLRLSELLTVTVSDIDGEPKWLRVEQG
jgi:integrase